MPQFIDLTGRKFERLIVVSRWARGNWICLCDCGEYIIVLGKSLRDGNTKSCGCLAREILTSRNFTHGMTKTTEHSVWKNMRQRCMNQNSPNFKYYGGRGISICQRWNSFENFFEDMGKCPEGLTLERAQNNLGYSKENCYWASHATQSRNRRLMGNNTTGINGISFSQAEKKYKVQINAKNIRHHVGTFSTLEQAKEARLKAEQKYWL